MNATRIGATIFTGLLILAGCASQTGEGTATTASGIDPENFKSEYRGDSTALYILKNTNGMEACITNFGGRLVSLTVPDKDGRLTDVVLGFDNVESYFPENHLSDIGASIGRYANRIDRGRMVIDGDTVILPRNNFGHCLHGGGEMGTLGWQYRVYRAEQPNDTTLVLTMHSPDGDNGFPGTVDATVTYTLGSDNSLEITYGATTDKPTEINMTNHAYFNLSSNPEKSVEDMVLMVNADEITPVDSTFMTTGEVMTVEGTPFDFRKPRRVGEGIDDTGCEQIRFGNGYDHNFVLATGGDIENAAAELYSPETGIVLTVYTTEPGIQVYSGNFLDGTLVGKKGVKYVKRSGLCLETQHFPDTPNKPQWPSSRLNPGESYSSRTIFRFSTR